MNKYFLDFGTNLGQGLEAISDIEKFDKDVEVHSFEANPFIFQKINFKPNVNYYNIAVSEFNGFFELNIDGAGGSTLLPLDLWNPEQTYGWKEGERHNRYTNIKVPSMSISNILETLLPEKEEKSIIAKFDVEGAEYGIFQELKDTDNFKWFSKIYVEFHDRIIGHTAQYVAVVARRHKGNITRARVPFSKISIEWMNHFDNTGIEAIIWD